MFKKNRKNTWYGMLQSQKKGNTVVIWDSILPRASTGKIFLFNTSKDKLVEYVEEIVQPKLRDLTGKELQEAKSEFDHRWAKVKARFVPVEEEPEQDTAAKAKPEDVELDMEIKEIGDDSLVIDDDLELE